MLDAAERIARALQGEEADGRDRRSPAPAAWSPAALTEIAGSSAVVDRGFVTYSNEAKQQMLGVPAGNDRRIWRGEPRDRRGDGQGRARRMPRSILPSRSPASPGRAAPIRGKAGRARAFRRRVAQRPRSFIANADSATSAAAKVRRRLGAAGAGDAARNWPKSEEPRRACRTEASGRRFAIAPRRARRPRRNGGTPRRTSPPISIAKRAAAEFVVDEELDLAGVCSPAG